MTLSIKLAELKNNRKYDRALNFTDKKTHKSKKIIYSLKYL